MKIGIRSLALLAAGTSLVGCSGGAQFTSLERKILLAAPAQQTVAEARATSTPDGAYNQALRAAYLDYADFELSQMNDYGDAIFHANRAIEAANGGSIEPQAVSERQLSADAASELGDARASLVAARDGGGIEAAPLAAATATASFDCWIEQAEEALQPGHIAACKKTFETAMAELTAAMTPQAAGSAAPTLPDLITLDSDVLFAFDSATIEPAAADGLVEVAELIMANPGIALTIQGHTDSVGSDAYNMGLSQRRADAVLTFMVNQGADPDRFNVAAFGESQPIATNDTENGRAQNRRVEIHSQ